MRLTRKLGYSWLDNMWKPATARFGRYEKVIPFDVTPPRIVPDHIVKPEYAELGIPVKPRESEEIKDSMQIQGMRQSCSLASKILHQVAQIIQPGVTTDAIDKFVHNLCISAGAYPSPLNYKNFPKSVCTSVNNVAVHGIPDLRPLADGDIINVDITIFINGFHGDCSKTFLVGNVDDKGRELVAITEECLNLAIKKCGPDVPFAEICDPILKHAKRHKLRVLPQFVGHGIGAYFHGPPAIYHTENEYPGVMKPGMTFTIEPVLSHGDEAVVILEDNWTVVTEDDARTAQVEHTVLITENGAEILTTN